MTTVTELPTPDMQNKNEPHYFGHRQRLREQFLKAGLNGFADHEVIELLLTLAIPRLDVKVPAKDLVERFGNLRGILDADIDELRQGSAACVTLSERTASGQPKGRELETRASPI